MVGGDTVTLGGPTVAGAAVAGEVVEQGRGAKVIAFKKRRRKNSRRKRGHRQEFTLVRITEILTDGAKPTKTARPKPERKPRPVAETAERDDDAEARSPRAPPQAKAGAAGSKGRAARPRPRSPPSPRAAARDKK